MTLDLRKSSSPFKPTLQLVSPQSTTSHNYSQFKFNLQKISNTNKHQISYLSKDKMESENELVAKDS